MDAEAVERRRMREAEEWRLKQLRSGVSSQDNSNFQVSAQLLPRQQPLFLLPCGHAGSSQLHSCKHAKVSLRLLAGLGSGSHT